MIRDSRIQGRVCCGLLMIVCLAGAAAMAIMRLAAAAPAQPVPSDRSSPVATTQPQLTTQPTTSPWHRDVFRAGQGGVHTYRIPATVRSPKGTLLVFCEARKLAQNDASPTDMVLSRSEDGGVTWSAPQALVKGQGTDAIMNPVAVVDGTTGTVFLVCCNTNRTERGQHRRHILLSSRDDGRTWAEVEGFAKAVADADDCFVSGPGCGIQTRTGRLIVPGYSITDKLDAENERGIFSRVLYSDDHGTTWKMGKAVDKDTNESQVVELSDGRLLMNMRQGTGQCCRAIAFSKDAGESWSVVDWDRALNECPCQGSIIRLPGAGPGGKDALAFANPDNIGDRYGVERNRLTVRLSYDEGKTWPVKKLVHAGPASYSGLVALPNGDLGLVFEGGQKHRREWIRFVHLPLGWVKDDTSVSKQQAKSVYVIGDSISMQYGPYLKTYLDGFMGYARKEATDEARLKLACPQGDNGGDSSMVLAFLKAKAAAGGIHADFLLLNCGLHDIKTNPATGAKQVTLSQYETNLRAIIKTVAGMGPRLIWVRTTPCDERVHNTKGAQFHRFSADCIAYNTVADRVMKEAGVPSIDLYNFTLTLGNDLYCDHVHFREPIRQQQAAFLAGWLHAYVAQAAAPANK